MAAKEMSMDDFLAHQGSSGGGGSVLDWKEDGQVSVLLHPKAPFYALWSSSWYRIGKDRDSGKQKLFFGRFNSFEDEELLKKQRMRGDDGEFEVQYPWHDRPTSYYGARKFPPQVCPFSLLIEWVREMIETDKIGWTDRIFDIDVEGGGDESATIIHAGGFTGLFKADELDDKEKAVLRKAHIQLNEAYREEGKPRMQYAGVVIPYAKPSEGPTIFIEAESLGKAFKKHINDLRDDKKDPRYNPVVFVWKYDDSKSFAAKYDVSVRHSEPITEEHQAALAKDYPKEALDRIVGDSNLVELREGFERWWCHDVIPPWDMIFKPAMEKFKGQPCTKSPEEAKESKSEGASDKSDNGSSAPASNENDELYECEHCHGEMAAVPVCPHCGATYDEAGNMTPPPPKEEPKPAGRRTRGSAK